MFPSLALLLLATWSVADLRVPAWYDEGLGVPDWHYRVPLTIPAGSGIGSTVEVDVDFVGLLDDMNVDTGVVTFDSNSPRVVRPNGSLVTIQEFTDAIFNNALDNVGDGEGQIRFLLEDNPGAGDYYIYFDITQNGAKPANPSTVINGHFEHSAGNNPSQWTRSVVNANGAQNNEVYATNVGQTVTLTNICSTNGATVDAGPNDNAGVATGRNWHLMGYRDACEDGTGSEQIQLSRVISVPAGAAAGVLEFYFQVQSFDGISNATNYDWMEFSVNGAVVNHTALGIDNTSLPQLRIDTNRLGRNGYGTNISDFGWKRAQLNLAPYQGTNITFQLSTRHSASDNGYRTWMKVDDVVWSLQLATLGEAEAFGANVVSPADTGGGGAPTEYGFGQTLALSAAVDADPTAVVADVYDDLGNLVATGIQLFDDGTRGDLVAGDNVWTNDGSDAGSPTYTIPLTGPGGPNWLVRVFALDGSFALGVTTDGLLMLPTGNPTLENQANFYNIDEQVFTVTGAVINLQKSKETLQDGVSLTDPKDIPGAWVRYEVRVENQGPDGLDNNTIVITDAIPTQVALCVSALCSATPDPVEYDESASPILTGLTYTYASNVSYSVDGVDFSYSPVPDGEGFDAAVRYVRVEPSGAMTQPNSGDNPEFDVRYTVRVE